MENQITLVHKKWKCSISKDNFSLKNDNVSLSDNIEEFQELAQAIREYRKVQGGTIKTCLHIADPDKDLQMVVKKGELAGFLKFIQEIHMLVESKPPCLMKKAS